MYDASLYDDRFLSYGRISLTIWQHQKVMHGGSIRVGFDYLEMTLKGGTRRVKFFRRIS